MNPVVLQKIHEYRVALKHSHTFKDPRSIMRACKLKEEMMEMIEDVSDIKE